jgi:DNA-directed RNA polymerase subunit RPC12/RpoP
VPIPPKLAFKSTCESCGWFVVIKHRSDAIFRPSQCERCGSENLIHTNAGIFETVMANPLSLFQNIIGKYYL